MKHTKLIATLNLVVSLQLMLSPLAIAQTTTTQTQGIGDRLLNVAGNVATGMLGINPTMGPVGTGVIASGDQQLFAQMNASSLDPQFNTAKFGAIDGFNTWLQSGGHTNRADLSGQSRAGLNPNMFNCQTLMAKPNQIKIGACQKTPVQDPNLAAQANAYLQAFESTASRYDNFTVRSNQEGYLDGVGCMENSIKTLEAFFAYREDELNKEVAEIQARMDTFIQQTQNDLIPIQDTTALLEGGNSSLLSKSNARNADIFKSALAQTKLDDACKSMITANNFLTDAKSNGFKKVMNDLNAQYTKADGPYSADSFNKNINQISADVDNFVKKASEQFNNVDLTDKNSFNNFFTSLKAGDEAPSTTGVNSSLTKSMLSSVTTGFNKTYGDIEQYTKDIQKRSQTDLSKALDELKNTRTSNFDNLLKEVEIDAGNNCLTSVVGDPSQALSRTTNITATRSGAQSKAANQTISKITGYLQDKTTTLDEKIKLLQQIEGDASRYVINTSTTKNSISGIDQNGKAVQQSLSNLNPAAYFIAHINHCQASLSSKRGAKDSVKSTLQQLRNAKQGYADLKASTATALKNALTENLLSCKNKPDLTSSASCGPSQFNPGGQGFCLTQARNCASSMQNCNQKINEFVKDQEAKQTIARANYNQKMITQKDSLKKLLQATISRFVGAAQTLNANFPGGKFSTPTDIQYEVPESERYLAEFKSATGNSADGELLLEDPKKYVELFEKNIESLKKSVKAQQDQIIASLTKHKEDAEKKLVAARKQLQQEADKCAAAVDSFNQFQDQKYAEQSKKQSEFGQKTPEFCEYYSAARDANPVAACGGDLGDLSRTMMEVAAMSGGGDAQSVAAFKRWCNEYNNPNTSNNSASQDVDNVCANVKSSNVSVTQELQSLCTQYHNSLKCKESFNADGKVIGQACDKPENIAKLVKAQFNLEIKSNPQLKTPVPALAYSAPSFCNAGDNSYRGNNMKGMLGETLNRSLSSQNPASSVIGH